ncbi:MAG: 16S rRNA (cytosine(1402)-N(4))-methyltransferase [Candidatus Liberibacter europaeus]|uniref:Ribosomal RNA small subunit methyltransferase H n=1 Tax=Candidatus Liberibacter europaeus TaxID=744859 RepID=A0A2T4VWM3_9HYPH|nr:16S rRNA (cytosine(1402)-N(4))-methyltransferase [Candidatus Liberibacter europaeus]PTL86166.1 MAG: 16S rRNA (cytosine(1402)-N(4))-methyltransferase [Candidatus Liberibacter europaeus]
MKSGHFKEISSARSEICCPDINYADSHIPVMLSEVVTLMNPIPGKIILDATFGAGGYSRSFCEMGANVIALDRDPLAVSQGQEIMEKYKEKFSLFNATFSQLEDYVPDGGVDGVVFDLGVSSMQIDCPERGFSFQKDGPLDMRMSCSGVSACDVINHVDVKDLIRILGILGEERQASRIAHAIVKRRQSVPFKTTHDLSSFIRDIVYINKKSRIHPSTRSFQALRMFVNDELGELVQGLLSAEKVLKCGGVLVVVSFHSLEDRIVKHFFSSRSGKVTTVGHMISNEMPPIVFYPVSKKVIVPTKNDTDKNRRSRSAKLRVGIRTSTQHMSDDISFTSLPRLPALSQFGVHNV